LVTASFIGVQQQSVARRTLFSRFSNGAVGSDDRQTERFSMFCRGKMPEKHHRKTLAEQKRNTNRQVLEADGLFSEAGDLFLEADDLFLEADGCGNPKNRRPMDTWSRNFSFLLKWCFQRRRFSEEIALHLWDFPTFFR
jgi:hypothetical protein